MAQHGGPLASPGEPHRWAASSAKGRLSASRSPTSPAARIAAAEARAARAAVHVAIVSAAYCAGAGGPVLLPTDAVTVDQYGCVIGVDEVVAALLADKPWLLGKPTISWPAPGSEDCGPQGSPPLRQWTRADLDGQTSDQIEQAAKQAYSTRR